MADFSLSGVLKLNASDFISEARDSADAIDDVSEGLQDVNEEADNAGQGMSGLADAANQLPGPFGEIGGALSGPGGIAAGIVGVGAVMGKLADDTARVRLEVADYAQLTGDSVENASRLLTVVGRVGVEANDLADITLQMSDSLAGSPEIVQRLGINLNDGKTAAERFVEVTGRLQTEITDATERGIIGAQLFGEEGVRQVNSITSQVGDLDTALKGVEDRNVVTQAQVDQAREYKQAMDDLQEALQGAAVVITDALLPSLTESAEAAAATGDALPIEDVIRWGEKLNDTVNPVRLVTDGFSRMSTEANKLQGAIDPLAGKTDDYTESVDDINRILDQNVERFEDTTEAAGDTTDAMSELDDVTSELLDTINDEQAWLNLQQSIDETSRKLRDQSLSSDEARLATLALKEEMILYVQTLDQIPEEKRTEIVTLIDEEMFNAANARIDILTRPRELLINTVINTQRVDRGGGRVPSNIEEVQVYGSAFEIGAGGFSSAVTPTTGFGGAQGFANPSVGVTVMIGQQELTEIVRTEVQRVTYEQGQVR